MKIVEDSNPVEYLNILLYGPPGVGKSACAATAPGPILWLNTEGRGALRFARSFASDKIVEVEYESDVTLREVYSHLQDVPYGTIVVDTIGELHKQLMDQLISERNADRGTLQMYGDVNYKIERFCRALRNLPCNVIFICHEQVVVNEATGNAMKMPITGGKQLPSILMSMVDVVGYCGVHTKDDVETYYSSFRSDGTKFGKDRTSVLGTFRKNDVSRWLEISLQRDNDPQVASEAHVT